MTKEMIEQINTELERKYGEDCALEIKDCGGFGVQMLWKNMALDFAGLDEIDEIMDELRTLRHELYYAELKTRHQEQRAEFEREAERCGRR